MIPLPLVKPDVQISRIRLSCRHSRRSMHHHAIWPRRQLASQGRESPWQRRARHRTSSVLGISQSAHLPSYSSESAVGVLRSTGITPLPHYYDPLRLPTRPHTGYVFPARVDGLTHHHAGPPRFLD